MHTTATQKLELFLDKRLRAVKWQSLPQMQYSEKVIYLLHPHHSENPIFRIMQFHTHPSIIRLHFAKHNKRKRM